MSKVFNMVSGGGKNISSIVITGLESTDTVTCTKNGKSYTATWDSTAQHWEIVGLPLGTFTVTATNGTTTTTETVLIDIAGVYEVEIDYKLWLYKDGDEFEDVTGGWESVALMYVPNTSSLAPTITRNSNNMVARISGEIKGGIIRCANTINLTNYKKIYFTGSLALDGKDPYPSYVRLVVWDKLGSYWNENVVTDLEAGGKKGTFNYENAELDISTLNGNHVIGFGLYSSNAAANDYAQVTLNSLYLE